MPLNLEGEATSDLDGLLETTDMSQQPNTLPSVQQLESFVLSSPVVHHADSQSHQAQHPPPSQSVYKPPQAHSTTADWVRGQQMQQYPPQHYQGSDPVRHASYSSSHEPNGLGQRPIGRPLSALYSLQPQPQPGPDVRSPKREIKRRTKTGCLTCRRRRIKCDEGQPTCGNCRKSKRECLGYDPIFKTTGLHGPVAGDLLGYSPTMQSNIHQLQHALRQPVHDSQPQSTQHAHQIQGQSTQHAHQIQGNAAASRPAAHAAHSHNAYDVPLDPSLSGSAPLAASSASQHSPPLEANVPGLRSYRKRKRTTMEDIYAADGVPSSLFSPYKEQTSLPHAQADEAELMPLWRSQYSGMLDSFFETQWYSQAGEYWLQSHQDTFRSFAQSNRSLKARDVDAASLSSLEARLVWLLAVLPRVAWAARKQADAQLADLLHRLDVVEHLLTGSILPPNLIPPAPATPPKLSARGPDPAPTPEFVSHSFWHNLGTFAAADDTAPAASVGPHHQTQLTSALQAMRHLLSVLENRDVLYSVAVARHYAGRLERLDLERLPAPPASDPEHPFAKLGVALRFLADEEHAGTTAVVRAVAGLARRGVARARDDD